MTDSRPPPERDTKPVARVIPEGQGKSYQAVLNEYKRAARAAKKIAKAKALWDKRAANLPPWAEKREFDPLIALASKRSHKRRKKKK